MSHRILLFLAGIFFCLPRPAAAQCHHMSGHAHSSLHTHITPHAHVHSSCRSHHYHAHYFTRSARFYSSSRESAQIPLRGEHDISAGSGLASGWQVTDMSITGSTPAFFAGYKYYVSRKVALGISAGTPMFSGNDTCHCTSNAAPAALSRYDFRVTTFTVLADVSWLLHSNPLFQVYQGISLGASTFVENDAYADKTTSSLSGVRFNGQLTLAGFRCGRALGAFAEIGYGYKGILCAGLSYQAGYRRVHT